MSIRLGAEVNGKQLFTNYNTRILYAVCTIRNFENLTAV